MQIEYGLIARVFVCMRCMLTGLSAAHLFKYPVWSVCCIVLQDAQQCEHVWLVHKHGNMLSLSECSFAKRMCCCGLLSVLRAQSGAAAAGGAVC